MGTFSSLAAFQLLFFPLTVVVDAFAPPKTKLAAVNPLLARTTTASGLGYEDLVVGDGNAPGSSDFVSVHYEGYLARNKKLIDSSRPKNDIRTDINKGKPLQFAFGRGKVIAGWEEGIKGMRVGGKRKLFVPSDLAYGDTGSPDGVIRKGDDLIFDIELVSVNGSMDTAKGLLLGFQVALGLIAVNWIFSLLTGHELREYVNAAIH